MTDQQRHDTLSMFSKMTPEQDKALMGERIQLIGRWHNLVSGQGVAVFESDSAEALAAYALNWNKFMDLDITVVMDDEQAREIGTNL